MYILQDIFLLLLNIIQLFCYVFRKTPQIYSRRYSKFLSVFSVLFSSIKRKWYANDRPQSSFRIESGGRVESRRRFWALSLAKILAHLGERAFSLLATEFASLFTLSASSGNNRQKNQGQKLEFNFGNSRRDPEKKSELFDNKIKGLF